MQPTMHHAVANVCMHTVHTHASIGVCARVLLKTAKTSLCLHSRTSRLQLAAPAHFERSFFALTKLNIGGWFPVPPAKPKLPRSDLHNKAGQSAWTQKKLQNCSTLSVRKWGCPPYSADGNCCAAQQWVMINWRLVSCPIPQAAARVARPIHLRPIRRESVDEPNAWLQHRKIQRRRLLRRALTCRTGPHAPTPSPLDPQRGNRQR